MAICIKHSEYRLPSMAACRKRRSNVRSFDNSVGDCYEKSKWKDYDRINNGKFKVQS